MGGDGGCRVSEVRLGNTPPIPGYKGLATVTVRDPPALFVCEFIVLHFCLFIIYLVSW